MTSRIRRPASCLHPERSFTEAEGAWVDFRTNERATPSSKLCAPSNECPIPARSGRRGGRAQVPLRDDQVPRPDCRDQVGRLARAFALAPSTRLWSARRGLTSACALTNRAAAPTPPTCHSIYAGDSTIFVDIFRFLFTTFSQPIAAALRAHGYYPPPRWPKDPASREQMIISHAFAGMRAICPSWQPQFDALEFLRERDLVAARITLILDVVKRLIAIHNRVVSTNKANLRARHAHGEQNVVRPSTVEPIVEEDDLPHRNESDESGSTTSRASSGANAPAPPEPKALKTPSRWLATEFFNEDELGLYQDQLQCAHHASRPPTCAPTLPALRALRGGTP